jgi:uncharacterized membrane protein YhaH (DUF805 family)
MKVDLPDEGGELRSRGSRRERWMAMFCNVLMAVGVAMILLEAGPSVLDLSKKTPWTLEM